MIPAGGAAARHLGLKALLLLVGLPAAAETIHCTDIQGASAQAFADPRLRPEARGRRSFGPDSIAGLSIAFELAPPQPVAEITLADAAAPAQNRQTLPVQPLGGGAFVSWTWVDIDGSLNVMSYITAARMLAWSIHNDRLGPLQGGAVVKAFTAACRVAALRG